MKLLSILFFYLLFINVSHGQQKYFTNHGFISFFSHSPLEDIKADNNQVLSVYDVETNQLMIYSLMKSFMFKKALMQEHFNENYVESDKYPKSAFEGKISDFDISNTSNQTVNISGTLSLHGKTTNIQTQGLVSQKDGHLFLKGDFMVKVADYDIKIPRTVINNIAKSIKVSFDLDYEIYK